MYTMVALCALVLAGILMAIEPTEHNLVCPLRVVVLSESIICLFSFMVRQGSHASHHNPNVLNV